MSFFFLPFSSLFEAYFLRHYKCMFLVLVLKEENPFPRVSHLLFLEQPRVTIFEYFSLNL